MSFFSRKKKSKPPTISKPFPPPDAQWNRDTTQGYAGYGYPMSAPARDYPTWRPPMPYFSPGSPPWKGSSNSSSERARAAAERYEGASSQASSGYERSDYGYSGVARSRQARARPDEPQYHRSRLRRDHRPPSPEEEELNDGQHYYINAHRGDQLYSEFEEESPYPHRPLKHQHQHYRTGSFADNSHSTTSRHHHREHARERKYSESDLYAPVEASRHLRPARSAANLTLAESDLYGDKTVVSTAYTKGRQNRPGTPSSQHSKRIVKKQPAPPATDGSDLWITKSSEPLARIRLNTVLKSLQESDESLFYSLTSFTLDLSEPDPSGTPAETFMTLTCQVLSYLTRLETLRIVGPKDRRIVLPASFAKALKESRAGLISFALSRFASIEEVAELARLVGPTCTTLKLNDCKLPVWRPFLRHCIYLESLEALVPPEGLTWFSRSQWAQMVSLRLGYGTPEALDDLLESATAVGDEEPIQTALETLVISHFAPLPLALVIRLSRTLGTPLVRKLELSRIQSNIFEPRLIQNLAAYFESVEDLRVHAAEDGEEELSLSEGRKMRTQPVDWTKGRYGVDDWGMALSAFPILRAVEVNHSRYPYLLGQDVLAKSATDTKSQTKTKSSHGEPSCIPDTPDGVPLTDLWVVDARGLANKCRTLKRVGYSFGVSGRYLDCSVKFSRTQRGALPIVSPHWSKPGSS